VVRKPNEILQKIQVPLRPKPKRREPSVAECVTMMKKAGEGGPGELNRLDMERSQEVG
jgi:hypothetical protein